MSNAPPEKNRIVVEDGDTPSQPSHRSRRIRRAIIVSIVAHAFGVIALLLWYIPHTQSKQGNTQASSPPVASATAPSATPPDPRPPLPPAPPANDVPDAEIQKSLESQIEAVERIPDERKLDQLEKNLRRLESVSNPESVSEVTSKITSSLGLDSDQYAPKNPDEIPPGTIDLTKAQLADVTRTRNEKGGWDYVSTLVDDNGREMKVPVSAAEGEAMYDTFQQMKKFPLAAGIYRSVVMPMMQKMIEASELADQAAAEAERINAETANPNTEANR